MPRHVHNHQAWLATITCSLGPALALTLTYPFAETGISDDWSYARSAEILAKTGHVVYNGWSTAMLGWQLYWGALFIKIFGVSWTVERCSVLIVSTLCSLVLFRLLLRCGISQNGTTLAVLTLTLSPLYLPLAFSFMSDVPGLFAIVVALYLALRAVQARSEGAALGWVLFATLADAGLATVRQICWLDVLVLIPTTVVLLWRNRLVRVWGTVGWVCGILVVWLEAHWFSAQDYSIPEHLLHGRPDRWDIVHLAASVTDLLLGFPLLMLPLWLPLMIRIPWSRRGVRSSAVWLLTLSVVIGTALAMTHHLLRWLQPTLGTVLSPFGAWDVPFGRVLRVVILGPSLRIVLSLLTLAATFALVSAVLTRTSWSDTKRKLRSISQDGVLLRLFGPFTLAYALLLIPRAMYGVLYDRYLLPLLAVAALFTMRLWGQRPNRSMYALAAAVLAGFAAYGVAVTHDMFALYRGRLQAIQALEATGVPRTKLRGGIEYDGTTELDVVGHMNDMRVVKPVGSYRRISGNHDWLEKMAPDVTPAYEFVLNDPKVGGATSLPPTVFHAWLGPHTQVFYTRLGPGSAHTAADSLDQ